MLSVKDRIAGRSVLVALALLLAAAPVSAEWSLDGVLEQIDEHTREMRGFRGQATVTERRGEETFSLTGYVSFRMDGEMRMELSGAEPRTILCMPGKMFEYEPRKKIATEYPTARNRDRLAQYAMLGFTPRGSALKPGFRIDAEVRCAA